MTGDKVCFYFGSLLSFGHIVRTTNNHFIVNSSRGTASIAHSLCVLVSSDTLPPTPKNQPVLVGEVYFIRA